MRAAYAVRKLGRAFLTVLLLLTFAFFILRITGDPAVALVGIDVPADALAAFRRRWGLDEPLWRQYQLYIGNVLTGDFGHSFVDNRPAWNVIADRLPKTLALMGLTALATLMIGIPIGIWAALKRNTWVDRLAICISVAGFSLPNFVVGLMLILLFGVTWRLLPTTGSETAWHYILPIVTMATSDAAVFARFTRSAMLEVLNHPFMRTAACKGASWRRAVNLHALPNASIPIVTVFGLYVGRLVAAAVITENVFAWPGIGSLLVISVSSRDLAVVQAIIIMVGTTMVIANLAVDLLNHWLDPRMSSV